MFIEKAYYWPKLSMFLLNEFFSPLLSFMKVLNMERKVYKICTTKTYNTDTYEVNLSFRMESFFFILYSSHFYLLSNYLLFI